MVLIFGAIVITFLNYGNLLHTYEKSFSSYAVFGFVTIILGVIAYYTSFIIGSILLPPVYKWRSKINGAPFLVGEKVEIIIGSKKGDSAIIYELWEFCGHARLEMGIEANQDSSDTYSYTAIRRLV